MKPPTPETHRRTAAEPTSHLAPFPVVNVFGVQYLHLRFDDGSDLYLTEYGRPFARCLMPENHWENKAWLIDHSERLKGTSTLYRIATRPVDGRSKDIVLKWNRMGQDIPGETRADDTGANEFNSPFEEFGLLDELRRAPAGDGPAFYTHRPLAIYVPRKYVEMERLGRRRYRMEELQRSHDKIELDWNRNYAVIYEWVKGIDADEACRNGLITHTMLRDLLVRMDREMLGRGFAVSDKKASHIIVRPAAEGGVVPHRDGRPIYAAVDFELLHRTPRHEQAVRNAKRKDYLARQAHRFDRHDEVPTGLTPTTIMGVDYIYGQVESTGGALWVVGRDPMLFSYFLPEKWRKTPRTRLSAVQQVYHTVTKDAINLVWRVSQVGARPDMDPFVPKERRILGFGYNSPFEEITLAMELAAKGIETTYPRAIYMTGHRTQMTSNLIDDSRHESHAGLTRPDGHPLLSRRHEYMIIWGYWNGPDEWLAERDEQVYEGIDALAAWREGRLTEKQYLRLMRATSRRLFDAGVEDLNLRGSHLLLSIDRAGKIVRDAGGLPLVRICNFELLRRNTDEGNSQKD